MFDGMRVRSSVYKKGTPSTDVDLEVGDEQAYVKYTVGFSPDNGHVWAVATSFTRKIEMESWEFPWHQACETHLNKFIPEIKPPVANSLILIIQKE